MSMFSNGKLTFSTQHVVSDGSALCPQVDVGHIDLQKDEPKIDDIVKIIKTTGKLTVNEGAAARCP